MERIVLRGLVVLLVAVACQSLSRKVVPCSPLKMACKCEFPDGRGLDLTPLRKFNSRHGHIIVPLRCMTSPGGGEVDYPHSLASLCVALSAPLFLAVRHAICPAVSRHINHTPHYYWPTLKTKPDYSVSVNPCGSMFKNETEDCFESSVCLNVSGTLTDLGSVKESQLVWESLGRTPSITFTKVINSTTVTTTVLLKCDEAQSLPKLEFITAIRNKYTLRLTTKEACLKSTVSFSGGGGKGGAWGVFSVLMLIGLVLLLVYFVAGFLVLKFIRGAQGLEAIPNHEFWFSIPKRFKPLVLVEFLVTLLGSDTLPKRNCPGAAHSYLAE
ncbi:hypothetical protein AAG570_004858 [Ranatra chinensis]|uniref:Autophagy-related protein 27 n=1 Tax=Ranatra chinensis TaxID=642074 RepID=A0ABD0YKI2_9HEMI